MPVASGLQAQSSGSTKPSTRSGVQVTWTEDLDRKKQEGAQRRAPSLKEVLVREGVQRFSAGVLDVLRPRLFNRGHHVGRHRDVIELFGHLAAVVVGPVEELQRGSC